MYNYQNICNTLLNISDSHWSRDGSSR